MQYTVVHSKDPYLLARLATDLQMSGLTKRYAEDNKYWHPFVGAFEYCWINDSPNSFNFGEHRGIMCDIRHELTSRNYIKVLTQILQP